MLMILGITTLLGLSMGVDLDKTELRMPGVVPKTKDLYLCKAIKIDSHDPHYIVGFTPHGSMSTAHHMLLYGCLLPGSQTDVWNCGEMNTETAGRYEAAPVCSDGPQIMYAWALDAPELNLPKGVGFKVGGATSVQYLVVQVHYMHELNEPDFSGLTLHSTAEPMPKSAGVMLMVTGGKMGAKSKENFETACYIDESVKLHPFAFRTHTHKHGRVVSGYRIRDGQWTLIGKKDPRKPQMFYEVTDRNLVIEQGDTVAARCFMENDEDRDIYIGPTGNDEMCNFYMMYWVDGDQMLQDGTCFSPGPPYYRWKETAGLDGIPSDVNQL